MADIVGALCGVLIQGCCRLLAREHYMCNACICCYDACDCEDFAVCCCVGSCDCICIRLAGCCAIGHESLGFDLTNSSQNECCNVSCHCCEMSIVNPSAMCRCAQQILCWQSVASLPFHKDYVTAPICACCGIQCRPACACRGAPPVAPIFKILRSSKTDKVTEQAMERE